MKKLSLLVLMALLFNRVVAQQFYLIAGTYNSEKSEGIYVYKFDCADGSAKEISHIKTSNPSYVVVSPNEKYIYAVHENGNNNAGGEVAAFAFDKQTGKLSFINQQLSGGDHPCYVETDKTGKWIFAGNYTSGSAAVFPVLENGSLGTAVSTVQHTGFGSNPARQSSPHVHSTIISPDNKYLLVPDLGIDKVMIYQFDKVSGKLTTGKQPYVQSMPGSGPRHFTFHPSAKYAYLIEELSGKVLTYKYKKGKLKQIQQSSTMVEDDTSFAGSADIHISNDGNFLYASNRGTVNNIAIYKINSGNGKLSLTGHQPVLGKTPRNFNFDPTGKFLLVANQNSDEIVIFERNSSTGMLKDSGQRILVGKPVCLKWISIQ